MCPDFDARVWGSSRIKISPAHSADVTSEKVTEYVSVIFMVLVDWAVWDMDKDCQLDLLGDSDAEFSNDLGVAAHGEEVMIYA
jgi:hypothetical protein